AGAPEGGVCGDSAAGEFAEDGDEVSQATGDPVCARRARMDPVVRDDRGACAIGRLLELVDVQAGLSVVDEAPTQVVGHLCPMVGGLGVDLDPIPVLLTAGERS